MNKTTGVYTSAGVNVKYIFRPAKKDCRHLIVYFSGFRTLGTVDFSGSTTDSLRANILWIIDEFDGHASYYMRAFGGQDITSPVTDLVNSFRQKLGLDRNQVTFAGFSKGGSSALYFGIAAGYPNIVATVPQIHVGSYIQHNWPSHLESIGGEAAVPEMDALIETAIRQDTDLARNIYLVTSPEDKQHEPEALPLARLLQKYDNFNLIVTRSPFVRNHMEVTPYNVPLLLSLMALLSEGVVPQLSSPLAKERQITEGEQAQSSWGETHAISEALFNGSWGDEQLVPELPEQQQLLAKISKAALSEGILTFEGYSVFSGKPITGYGQIATTLMLKSHDSEITLRIGSTPHKDLSLELFSGALIDYTYGGITTLAKTGYNLLALPFGIYTASITSTQAGVTASRPLPASQHTLWELAQDRLLGSRGHNGAWEILVLPAIGRTPTDTYFEEIICKVDNGRLFLEGYFVPRGRSISDYSDIRFHLCIAMVGDGAAQDRIIRTVPLAAGARPDASARSGEPWRDQSKAYYATPRYEGVEIGSLPTGTYQMFVTARIGDDIQSFALTPLLLAEQHFSIGRKPVVGVIGSCVTRDNFSSQVVKNWRHDYDLHGAQYQMALVSLMAPPVTFSQESYADLDTHSRHATQRDFSKEYLEELTADQPDYLLIDAFADARFGVLRIDDSCVTDNAWNLGIAQEYAHFDQHPRASMAINESEYLELFRNACLKLKRYLTEHSPRTQVFIVSAREVAKYRGRTETGTFANASTSRLNDRWEQLDQIAEQVFGCPRINPMDPLIFASSDHPWGKGPVHYESRYYQNFREAFLRELGATTTLSLAQTALAPDAQQ